MSKASSSSIPVHPWEESPHDSRRPDWESDGADSDVSVVDAESAKDIAAAKFLDTLEALYNSSRLSSEDFCVLCNWAAQGGMAGNIGDYGYRPGAQSGHYARFLKSKMGFKDNEVNHYLLQVQGSQKSDPGRSKLDLVVIPPHEALQDEFLSEPKLGEQVSDLTGKGDLPPAYTDHVIVRSSATPVLPISLYMDGVSYSLTDTAVGIWIINNVSQTRHLVALVRKRLACKCGRRGYCTFNLVLQWLKWSFAALAKGEFPRCRHDSTEWQESDSWRKQRQGTPLRFKCAVVWLKGDWAEFCERLGFPTWASAKPCFVCDAGSENMYNPVGFNMVTSIWNEYADSDYDAACRRCEKRVCLNAADHKMVKQLLFGDKRERGGSHGRALRKAVAHLGLEAGDRLEPDGVLVDVGEHFDNICRFPVWVVFWRCSAQTLCTHARYSCGSSASHPLAQLRWM